MTLSLNHYPLLDALRGRRSRRFGLGVKIESGPFRTVLGYQASHVDGDFYQRFYRPEALTANQGQHLADWHPDREIL
jgi:hypothetical protein